MGCSAEGSGLPPRIPRVSKFALEGVQGQEVTFGLPQSRSVKNVGPLALRACRSYRGITRQV